MQNRYVQFYTDTITTTYNPQTGEESRTGIRVPSGYDFFSDYTGVIRGDFKSPNAHNWSKRLRKEITGQITETAIAANKVIKTIEGDIGRALPEFVFHDSWGFLFNKTLSDCYDQVRGTSDWSVTLAQSGQVASMVKKGLNLVRHVKRFDLRSIERDFFSYSHELRKLRRLHKGNNLNELAAAAKDIGGNYLEYVYGLKPLCQDIYNTAVTLGRQFPSMMVVEAKASDVIAKTENLHPYTERWQVSHQSSQRVHMKMRFRPSNETSQLMSAFTSMNPASILWELVPFSFVADWFYDVGGYMRSVESSLLFGNSFVDGFWTQTQMSDVHVWIAGLFKWDADTRVSISGEGSNSFRVLKRNPIGTAPFPESPSFRADLGSGRLLNAAALVSQHLKIR